MKDKIRKLLALASDPGAAPQEAETAARQAARLMAMHEISMADLEEEQLKAEFDLVTGEAPGCRPGKKNPSEVPTWIGIIGWGIKCYTRTRIRTGRGVIYFSGPREDVELAQWLHALLVKSAYTQSQGRGISEANAFRNGFASAIQGRLKTMVLQRVEEEVAMANGQRYALVKVQDVRERLMDEAYGPEQKGRSSQVKSSQEGYAAGQRQAIPQGRPVSHSYLRLN